MGNKLYSILLCMVIYLISSTNFYYAYIESYTLCLAINAFVRLLGLVGIFIIMKSDNLPKPKEFILKKSHLWFLPFFVIPFSNILAGFISGNSFSSIQIDAIFFLNIVIVLFTAFAEELCFRALFLGFLETKQSKMKALLFSALLFGSVHLLNINGIGSIPVVLLQVLYSCGIGLVTGLIYVYGNKFSLAVIFHFMFNFFNGFIANYISSSVLVFYLVNIGVAVIFILYGIFLYKYFEKKDRFIDFTNDKNEEEEEIHYVS